ncbi:hypothetical protein PMAYCL1PPCAC_15952, partial [Pristionchus mayeri]
AMPLDSSLVSLLTLSLGFVGLAANSVLILAILLRTPLNMRVYSRLLLALAVCDLAGVLAMMLSITEENLFSTASILHFHGVCTSVGVDFCCVLFGVQEHMYSATSMLLSVSFAYRLRALDLNSNYKKGEAVSIPTFLLLFDVLS